MKATSILKKAVMALTGISLVGFLVVHLAGNLALFAGPHKFNGYSKFLEEQPLLIPAEIALVAIFLIHVFLAIKLTLENKEARPVGYDTRATAGQSSVSSRTMMITGFVVLIFVVVHVSGFKFGERPDGSLWQLVIDKFSNPGIAGFYIVCMGILGFHLGHGIGSVFQSLGLRDRSGRPTLRGLAPVLAWALAIGFALLPVWVLIKKPAASNYVPQLPIEIKLNDANDRQPSQGPTADNNKPAAKAHVE